MAGTPEAVVYEQAVAASQRQIETFRDLRGRSGAILSAASLASAFLGGQALDADTGFTALVWRPGRDHQRNEYADQRQQGEEREQAGYVEEHGVRDAAVSAARARTR